MLTKDKVAKRLANRLRQLRQSRGISQENLAIESGVGNPITGEWSKGQLM